MIGKKKETIRKPFVWKERKKYKKILEINNLDEERTTVIEIGKIRKWKHYLNK